MRIDGTGDRDFLQGNTASCRIKCTRIDNLEHRISAAEGIVKMKMVRIKLINGVYGNIFCLDFKGIVRCRAGRFGSENICSGELCT